MIIFDTETTGLIDHEALPLEKQPRIIEIGAVLWEDGREIDCFSSLVNPGVPLSPEITRITGLKDEDLKDAPPFIELYGALYRFFEKAHKVVAHNCRFDQMMLIFELRRCGLEHSFRYPMEWIDSRTVYPGRLQRWAAERDPTFVNQSHRALDDARLLARLYSNEIMLKGNESGVAPWGGAAVAPTASAQEVPSEPLPIDSTVGGSVAAPSNEPGSESQGPRPGPHRSRHSRARVRADGPVEPAGDQRSRKRSKK